MRKITLGLLTTFFLAGCVVVHEYPVPAAPSEEPAPVGSTGTTPYVYSASWPDVRYVLWTEYYNSTPQEVYYLENTGGYDDCDMLYMLCVSRWAHAPIRQVVDQYDRCGRSLFILGLSYGLSGYEVYCPEVPPNAYCPPPYRRAYGTYWGGRVGYLTNAECRALVNLKIGIEYYGYGPGRYFDAYSLARRRGVTHPFRTMAVRDCRRAGTGGRTALRRPVTRRPRPWEAKSRSAWETYRLQRRGEADITAARERERAQQARRIPESALRKKMRSNAIRRTLELKAFREQEDRGYTVNGPVRATAPSTPRRVTTIRIPYSPSRSVRQPRATVFPAPGNAVEKNVPRPAIRSILPSRPSSPPRQPSRIIQERIVLPSKAPSRTAERRTPPAPKAPIRRVQRRVPPPAPKAPIRRVQRRVPPPAPKAPIRRVQRRVPPPAPKAPIRRVQRRAPPPAPKAPIRRVERRAPPPPPKRSNNQVQRRTPPPSPRSGQGSQRKNPRRK